MLGAVQRGLYQLPGDTLAFSWLEDSRGAIIHFDSEQSRSDWHALVCRSVARSGRDAPSPRLGQSPGTQAGMDSPSRTKELVSRRRSSCRWTASGVESEKVECLRHCIGVLAPMLRQHSERKTDEQNRGRFHPVIPFEFVAIDEPIPAVFAVTIAGLEGGFRSASSRANPPG